VTVERSASSQTEAGRQGRRISSPPRAWSVAKARLWVEAAEAAELLEVEMSEVLRMINDGTLPGYRIGGRVRVRAPTSTSEGARPRSRRQPR
jgi:excisionase family DNA binding protein